MNAKILVIKIGEVQTLTFADGSIYESAIRKQPVKSVKIHTLGAEGNDVGLKKQLVRQTFFLYGNCHLRRKFCGIGLK